MKNTICENCGKDSNIFVKYVYKNGTEHVREQCLSCGRLHSKGYLKKNFNIDSLPLMDKYARERYSDLKYKKSMIKIILSEYSAKHYKRQLNYYRNKYLHSEEWKHKRQLIMDYYNWTCQKCGLDAQDLHHTTYKNIFKEKFEDLQPLCRACHKEEHELIQPLQELRTERKH